MVAKGWNMLIMSCSLTLSLRFLMTKVLSGSRLVRWSLAVFSLSLALSLLAAPGALDFVLLLLLLVVVVVVVVLVLSLSLSCTLSSAAPVDSPFSFDFAASFLSEGGNGGVLEAVLEVLLAAVLFSCTAVRLGVLGALPETTRLAQDPGVGLDAVGAGCCFCCCCCCCCCCCFPPLFFFPFPSFDEDRFFPAEPAAAPLVCADASSSSGASSFVSSTPPPGALASSVLSLTEPSTAFSSTTSTFFSSTIAGGWEIFGLEGSSSLVATAAVAAAAASTGCSTEAPTELLSSTSSPVLVLVLMVSSVDAAAAAAREVAVAVAVAVAAMVISGVATKKRKMSLRTAKLRPILARKNVWTNFRRRASPVSRTVKMTTAVTTNKIPLLAEGWASMAPSSNSKSIVSPAPQPQTTLWSVPAGGTGWVGSDPSAWLR
mmetsp:Transcript_4788/g.11676  ORF Transcript_4788/g.11676 Transcript_4788/m.11676 type:complete len:430 (-) Transcript_4788:346-1635(-)